MVGRRVFTAIAGTGAAAIVAAGCGILAPSSGPSGMERQIVRGEQVSAATRARVSVPVSGPATRRGDSSAPRAVQGGQVTAIGDSVMAASAVALDSVLPGIYIDAEPSRQWAAGLDVVRSLAGSGRLRPVVVVGLGTNYIVTTGQLSELMRLIGPDRRLVLINTYVPDSWSREVNATMAAFVKQHPGIVLADWFDLIKSQTSLLWPDEVHPLMAGTTVYARLVYQAVQATRGVTLAAARH